MATFVIVPGGYHGGWWFQPVVADLRAAGHDVHPVTLTGVGERRHLAAGTVNLDTHIDDVVGLLDDERLDDVVLCAHSYGGMVVTGAADRRPDRIAALVFVDAQVPRDGESLFALTSAPERERLLAAVTPDGIATAPPPGLDERTAPHPLASMLQPIRLTGAWEQVASKYYVWLSGWDESPTRSVYDRLRGEPGWDLRTWPIGHDVVGEGSERLVALLASVADRLAPPG